MRGWFLLVSLAAFIQQARSALSFITPGDNSTDNGQSSLEYKVGDKIDVVWKSDQSSAHVDSIEVEQRCPQGPLESTAGQGLATNITATSLEWTVEIPGSFRVQFCAVISAWFILVADGETAYSRTFNISQASAFSSQTTSSTTATGSIETNTPTASAAARTNKSGNKGLSSGAVAGISIGATLVAIGFSGTLAFFLWRRRNNKAEVAEKDMGEAKEDTAQGGPSELSGGEMPPDAIVPVNHELSHDDHQIHELPNGYIGSELPGDSEREGSEAPTK